MAVSKILDTTNSANSNESTEQDATTQVDWNSLEVRDDGKTVDYVF